MDRSNISVAASAISEDLSLTPIQTGLVFSAFAWTYSFLQIPGGLLVDLVKPRILYPFMLFFWSLATLFQAMVNSLGALVGLRTAVGLFEAPSYPCNNKIATAWFPEEERASAIAVYTSGQFIGLAFLTPVLILIQDALGWRGLFIVTGCIGIMWALIWYVAYRDPVSESQPSESPSKPDETAKKWTWQELKQAFIYRKLWGIYLGQFCIGSIFIFFLTWFPTYLVEEKGIDFIQSGFLASIPFLAAFVGVLLSGFLSDYLIRKGYSREFSRKMPVLAGMLLSISIIGANYTQSPFWIIFFLSLSFLGNGLASITWVFVSLIAPRQIIGLIGGVFNFMGGLSAVLVPIAIGYFAKEGDFRPALLFIGILGMVGFMAYVFLVGKVERIELTGPT